jgi:hypothetical protein
MTFRLLILYLKIPPLAFLVQILLITITLVAIQPSLIIATLLPQFTNTLESLEKQIGFVRRRDISVPDVHLQIQRGGTQGQMGLRVTLKKPMELSGLQLKMSIVRHHELKQRNLFR